MGRTDGKLIPFLKEALKNEKYFNLWWEIKDKSLILDLPRQNADLDPNYEQILKDYYMIDGRQYVDYSTGKSVIKAAMNKSSILRRKPKIKSHYRYDFLPDRPRKTTTKMGMNSPSSSGYGSSSDAAGSPLTDVTEPEEEKDLLPVIDDCFLDFLNNGQTTNDSFEMDELFKSSEFCEQEIVSEGVDTLQNACAGLNLQDSVLTASSGTVNMQSTIWIFSRKFDIGHMKLLVFEPQKVVDGFFCVPYIAVSLIYEDHNILLPAELFQTPKLYDFKFLGIENECMLVLLK